MPEGDTVWLTAKRLHQALAGRELIRGELRVPQLATVDLSGHLVLEVVPRGKHILARLADSRTLHSHLRMDGSWQLDRAGITPRAKPAHMIRAVLGNDQWQATGYRIHDLKLVRTADEHLLIGHLGPDLLAADWDATEAVRRLLTQPERAIGEALLDQRNLAGIGNMYRAELLFIERVHPWRPVAQIPDLTALVTTAQRLLWMNRDHPEQSTTGSTVRGRDHWVYGRRSQPCLRCRSPIAYAEQGRPPYQRGVYWCPRCQSAP